MPLSSVLGVLLHLLGPIIDHVATHYRPLAMVVIVLPLSFMLRNLMSLRDWAYSKYFVDASPQGHERRVARVVSDVQARMDRPAAERRRICTARAPWQNLSTRFSDYKKHSDCIFVGDLRSVISLDAERGVVTLEPLVDVGTATRWLLPRGYIRDNARNRGGDHWRAGLRCRDDYRVSQVWSAARDGGRVRDCAGGRASRQGTPRQRVVDLWHTFPWSHGPLGCSWADSACDSGDVYVRVDYNPIRGGIAAYSAAIRGFAARSGASQISSRRRCFRAKTASSWRRRLCRTQR